MDIRELESFVVTAEKGGISKAAAFLGLSQPAVSKHIAKIEDELGIHLLVRGHSRSVLTPEGRILYEHAVKMLELRRSALREIAESGVAVSGLVRIGASSIPGDHLLPPLLVRFREIYPQVEVEVFVTDTRKALDDLVERKVDLAVVGAERHLPGLVARPFFTDELVLVTPPDHPLAAKECVRLQDVAALPCIGRVEGSGTRGFVEQVFRSAGLEPPRSDLRFDHATAVVNAVAAGGGVGIVSRRALSAERCVGVVPFEPRVDRSFFLVHGVVAQRALTALVAFLSSEVPSCLHD